MSDCLFCKIISGDIPAKMVAENDSVVAFQDINPQAPVHILIVPRGHVASVKDMGSSELPWMAELTAMAQQIAKEKNLDDFRLVMNTGSRAGQSVFHLHMHLLGGRDFSWPPG